MATLPKKLNYPNITLSRAVLVLRYCRCRALMCEDVNGKYFRFWCDIARNINDDLRTIDNTK